MAKREAGNDRPLILDDVVVSLDRNHRGMIVDLLTSQFADRQVIFFTHDRDWYWYAELRHQLGGKQWGFKAPYETPELGIRWSEKTITVDEARANLKERPDSAGNDWYGRLSWRSGGKGEKNWNGRDHGGRVALALAR